MSASLRLRVHKAPLTETPPPPILLAGGPLSIGRRDDSGWVLPDASANVSRKHATVEERNGVWLVIDESANGTLHNGALVGRGNARPLSVGDTLKIGDYEIVVEPVADAGPAPPRGMPMAPPVQPLADPYGVGDFARADFGAPPPTPSGPSPFDPPPPERLADAPRAADLFGDFGANQVAPGIGVRAGGEAPVAAFGGLDSAVDPMAQHGASAFGPADAPASFGAPPQGAGGDWNAPPPSPAPSAGPLVTDPLSSPGAASVFGDQFGSADAIRNPLAGAAMPRAGGAPSAFGNEASPFGSADPVGYGRDQAPAPLGFDAVAVPEIGGPGAGGAALPSDWNAAPLGGPAPPPADLDPIEQALAGLKSPGRPEAPARAMPDPGGMRRPAPASPPAAAHFGAAPEPAGMPQGRSPTAPELPGAGFFGSTPTGAVEDAFAHPAAPPPAMPPPPAAGTPVGTPSGPAPAPSAAFQPQSTPRPKPAPRPAAPAAAPAARPAPPPAGDALLRAFMEGAGLNQLPADLDPEQAMRTLGSSGRAIVATLARLLEARRLLKGEFRITQTVVGARENNPLKFSVDESELMLVLLGSVRPGFQRGEAAVWDAGRDLEAHQLAMLSAFRAVLDAVFARLSPDAVASGEEAGFFGRLLPQARDAALWERYAKIYADLRQDIGNTLAGRLGQIFAEAYEAENGRRGGSG
jgi:FHA domain-containing protein